jgi:DNA-binding NtrC family response regulator
MATLHEVTRDATGPPKILLMEDELNVARGLKMILSEEGYDVDLATTGQSALDQFHQKVFDLLVADLRLPDIDGMEVIKQVKEEQPETEVVVITGFPSVTTAVKAMKIGAFDYLPKPFTEEELKTVVESALSKEEMTREERVVRLPEGDQDLIQRREVMRVLNRTAEDMAFSRELMESGTEALEDYILAPEARAAILSGDLRWLNENVGELTQKQLMFIHKRLEREAW